MSILNKQHFYEEGDGSICFMPETALKETRNRVTFDLDDDLVEPFHNALGRLYGNMWGAKSKIVNDALREVLPKLEERAMKRLRGGKRAA